MKKNEEIVVEIVDHGMKGEGIAKLDGQVIFVPGAIRGEKVKIRILKVTAGCAYGKVVEVLEPSAARVQSDCETFGKKACCFVPRGENEGRGGRRGECFGKKRLVR